MIKRNEIRELVDASLADEYDTRQMNLVLLAASLCIQQSSIRRPQMSQVIQVKVVANCESPSPIPLMII